MQTRLFKQKRFWFGLAVTAVFLYLVFRQVDLRGLRTALMTADYRWLLPAFAVYIFGYLVRAVRWKYLLLSLKHLPWTRLLPPLILGFTVNNVLPARAGEFVGAYLVGKRENLSKASAFATVIIQRAFDGLVMVLFAVIVLYLFRVPLQVRSADAGFVDIMELIIKLTATLFVLLFAALFLLITWKEKAVRVLMHAIWILPAALRHRVERLLHSFISGLSVLRQRRDSFLVFALSLLAWVCESAAYYFVLRAFGFLLPAYAAVMLMAVINLGIMIPSSPGYIGPFEFFGVGTLLLFGISKAASLPCILVIHTLVWLPITLWGCYYLWTLKLSLHKIESEAPAVAEPQAGALEEQESAP